MTMQLDNDNNNPVTYISLINIDFCFMFYRDYFTCIETSSGVDDRLKYRPVFGIQGRTHV